MKTKIAIFGVIFIFFCMASAGAVIDRTLIDFSKYDDNVKQQFPEPAESYITNVDGFPKVVIGYKDYMLENWKVELNESADMINNRINSYCKPVMSQRFNTTLGVRVHFPSWNNNSYAVIKPPFPIKIYDTNGQFANAENGVMPNVSEIKSLAIWANGRNYRFGLAIRLKDRFDNIHEFFFGWLYFDGWRKLVFNNPNFTEKVSSKTLTREPLYPFDIPYYSLDSIVVYRPADQIGGDFVTYIKSVDIEYTPYIIDDEVTQDIKDEQVWGIITARTKGKMDVENKKFAEDLYLYQQEKKRMGINNSTNAVDRISTNAAAAPAAPASTNK
ncbi:MAG: flagellar filament outer layer protein FlaA [Brevinematales bacterium]|jgi:hypothetical protein